ncbi:oxidoreductase [Pseudonocardia sulfidoxydans NBRC 16205]|uniref:Oxidoreductase n=1 Tax=Pseudonocardia sulfidoxydans NBRC 16205 TaxID=1223511 RepID=A0A511D8H8_9PSEU|nr:FAD-dependent oxidoreductase [Pseudonocardia sulfidoxydans]GEL21099.1 oxidoreductase [Pseudonocardia sulfidoxydans NBRC 16205]
MDAIKAVLSPTEIGGVALRNRVVVPGHTTNFGHANLPTPRHVEYHRERARGGVGLIVTEAVRVHPTSAGRHISLGSFDDSSIPAFAAMAEAVQAEGAKLFAQIMHAGRQANGDATRTVAWSASPLRWTSGAQVPRAMGRRDLDTVVDAFGAAATRMQLAGLDGLEVHLGHGHLLQQFLSPVTNRRDDEYGGSLENRMRLTRRVLGAVRGATDLPVGIRISADEFLPGGLDVAQMVEIVGLLREEFPLAYVHVSHSAYHGSWSLSTQMADMSFGHAPFRHHAAAFRRALAGLPVIAVCRLDTLPEAAELVADGDADLVALARPHIADPHLVRKVTAGRAQDVRNCLACNQGCISRVEQSLPISCVVNPEVGAEGEWSAHRERAAAAPARRVLVVGGGPAGLEAALSARRAGHTVRLVEATEQLGGQIRTAARVHGRDRLALLVEDLVRAVRAAGVEIVTGHRVSPAEVVDGDSVHGGWDDVVVATGSRPARRELPGGPRVVDIWTAVDLVEAEQAPTGTVLVLDDDGGWPGASLAERFAGRGAQVHLVSPSAPLSPKITTYSKLALVPRLSDLGVHVHLMCTPEAAGPDAVDLVEVVGGARTRVEGVTLVVDAGSGSADDELHRALDALVDGGPGPRLHLAGDANSPRTALEALYEGRLAGAVHTTIADPAPFLLALTR